jgi:hypothetical protein
MLRTFYQDRVVPAWYAFARALGDFFEEAAFRLVLASCVIAGRMPRRVERRWWNRAVETPVLIDVLDWTDDRRIFSVLVWPSLESSPDEANQDHRNRVRAVLDAIARGAADKAWSTRFETDYSLKWDHDRRVWTASDGFAYDGRKADDASREGAGSWASSTAG